MADELVGKDIGAYKILHLVGQGGMARVYLALQQSMNRQVALKVLPRQFLSDDTYLQRFTREVKIVSQLEHRNIVPVYDYGEFEGLPYIVMRYMPSGSVEDQMQAGRLAYSEILNIFTQISPALDYAHSKNVLHRDLKPSNILRDQAGGAFITDFGIAKLSEGGVSNITTQGVVGTPSYMSPEQAQGKEDIDGRSDIYALGVMLFEMTTGRRPFEAETPYAIAVKQVTTPPPKPRSLNPSITPALEAVILMALAKEPPQRYSTAGALLAALHQAIEAPESASKANTQEAQAFYQAPMQSPADMAYSAPEAQYPAPPVYPTPSQAYYVPSSQAMSAPYAPAVSAKRSDNPLGGLLMGGAVGCFFILIAALAALIAYTLWIANNSNTDESSLTPESTLPNVGIVSQITPSALPQASPSPSLSVVLASPQVFTTNTPAVAELPRALQGVSGEIVYHANPDSTREHLWVMDLNTRSIRKLTSNGDNTYPMPSPDGRWIAFQSNRDGDFEIFVLDRVTGEQRQLTSNDYTDRVPQWTPDSQGIIYSSDVKRDGMHDLYRVEVVGSEPTLVFSSEERKTHARVSPDKRYLVFTTSREPNNWRTWEIGHLDLATNEFTYLTQNQTRDASPVFSPDGNSILYASLRNGSNGITLMNLDGSNQRVLYNDGGDEWSAGYSLEGQYILFTSGETTAYQLWLMTADGTNATQLTISGGSYGWFLPPLP
jgi:serine/threonine protein kinase